MGKKIIISLHANVYEKSDIDITNEIDANRKLSEVVTYYKNKITDYYHNKTWDKYKKLTNEYELIFTSPNATYNVSKYIPVSRSFFKLWEIIHDFKNILFSGNKPMKCLFLAEGPGGFAEALMKFRSDYMANDSINDEYYGITLKAANNKNVPEWKYKNSKLHILFGADGTGNLYNVDNIDYLQDTLGCNSIDFITADGGFDFSSDFNNQEEMSLHLLTCEVYAALRMQNVGGTFIIKVFDLFSLYTLNLINILSNCYTDVKIVKPLTSRPANSEKYLVCIGFKGCSGENLNILKKLLITDWPENGLTSNHNILISSIEMDHVYFKNIVLFNTFYISRQIQYIQKTIEFIQQFETAMECGCIKKILDNHVDKVRRWCREYDIPY